MYLDYNIPCISRQLYACYVPTDFILLNLVALVTFDDYLISTPTKAHT